MKKDICITIIQGMAVTAAFLATEIVLQLLGAFDGDIQLYLVDIPLRLLFGTIALVLLANSYKKQRNRYKLKELFTNKIPGSTYVLLLPFVLYLVAILLTMIAGEFREHSSIRFVYIYSLNCGQQLATGYYEEAVRALLMCGLLKHCTDTKKSRVQTIVIAGICFGLSHGLNFFFGVDVISTLWQMFNSCIWGLFIAAIYMLSDNLTLIMILHAVWDIVIRVPNTFCIFEGSSVLMDILYITQEILRYGFMPMVAIYICIRYDKLRGSLQ